MSAKEQIIRARSAEKEAAKFYTKILQGEEKAKLAEEKRQEKGFELKKLEREWEASRITCCPQLSLALDHMWLPKSKPTTDSPRGTADQFCTLILSCRRQRLITLAFRSTWPK